MIKKISWLFYLLLLVLVKQLLTKKIQQKYKNFKISVSHTTRTPRSNEVDGVDYHFVSKEKFKELIDKENFMNMQKFLKIIMEH